MPCIEDHSHFLAWSGLLISTIAYLSPCIAQKSWWIKWLLGALTAQMAYAVLAAYWPDVFSADLVSAVGTMAGLFLVLMLAFHSAAAIMLLGSALLLLGPFVSHQIMSFTAWLRDNVSGALPPWTGVALFVALIVGLGALLWVLRIVAFVRAVVYVVVGAVLEFIYLRLVWIEAEFKTRQICCDWSNGDEQQVYDASLNTTVLFTPVRDNSRCPLDTASVANAFLLAALLLFAAVQVAWWYSRPARIEEEKKRKESAKKKKNKAATTASQRYAKVHESPEPEEELE